MEPDPVDSRTAGGIIVENGKRDPTGTVVAVGPEVTSVSAGQRVLFSPFHYEEIPGGRHLLDEQDIWALLDD